MKNFNWKPGAIAFGIALAIFVGCIIYVKSGVEGFKVTHFDKVESTYGADDRAAVGGPEYYQVNISTALAWKFVQHNKKVKPWLVIGWVFLIGSGVFLVLLSLEAFDFGTSSAPNYILFVTCGIALACFFGAYSSAFVGNSKKLTPAEYSVVKGDPDKMAALFNGESYIR